MTAPGAVGQSVALINQGVVLDLHDWAQIVDAGRRVLALHGARDPGLELAAVIGDLLAGDDRAVLSSVHPICTALSAPEVTIPQVRTVFAMATHAARRNRLPVAWDALLDSMERFALTPGAKAGPAQGLETALASWAATAARVAAQASPRVATVIGHQQIGLLAVTGDLAARIRPDQTIELDVARLSRRLAESSNSWREAIKGWASAPRVEVGRDATALSVAAVDLRDALMSGPATGETLTALLRTGVGGNLLVAASIDRSLGSGLVAAAHHLDATSGLVASNARDLNLVPSQTVASPTTPVAATQQMEPRETPIPGAPKSPARPAPVGDPVPLTAESERELARQRDVGVIAQAVLDGVPAAQAMLGDATQEELARLVSEGREAVGVMVSSAERAIWSRVRRYSTDLDERFAVAAVAVTAAAHKWDPNRSRWLGYAIRVSDWALAQHYRARARLPLAVRMDEDRDAPGGIDPARMASACPNPADIAVANMDAAKAAQAAAELPWPFNEILRRAMGFTPQGAPTPLKAISQDVSLSPATVQRRLQVGLSRIRREMGVDR